MTTLLCVCACPLALCVCVCVCACVSECVCVCVCAEQVISLLAIDADAYFLSRVCVPCVGRSIPVDDWPQAAAPLSCVLSPPVHIHTEREAHIVSRPWS